MWTRQPQYPAPIDQSNPLTRGLIAAVNPATGICHVTGNRINYTGGAKRTVVNGEVCVSTEDYGPNIYAHVDYKSRDYSAMSMLGVSTPRNVVTNRSIVQFASTTDGNPFMSIRSGGTTASKLVGPCRTNGGNSTTNIDSATDAFIAGKRVVVAFDMIAPSGAVNLYINGVADANTSTTWSVAGYTVDRLGLGAISNFDGNEDFWDGETSLYLVWDRVLSPDEHARIAANPWQVFAGLRNPAFYAQLVSVQLSRPVSDVTAGTWTASTGSDLYAMLDETVASDTDYIVTTGASTCEVALGSLSDPAVSTGHKVRYRLSANTGGITVRLRQGTTTIATWTHSPAPASLTTYEQTLTGGEADSITNYAALKLQFEATA